MNPLVSVIVPCYNHEHYVESTISSIINQSYKNIELIVLDDGSKDNSPKILQLLSKKYNFYFEHQQNIGLTATLNKALALANGKYICIVASDDYWPLHKIEIQVQFMEQNQEYAMSYGKMISIDANSNIIDYMEYQNISGNIFENIFISNVISAPTAIIRKEILDSMGGYDESLPIEDLYMWLKISEFYPIGFIDDYLAYYRMHTDNTYTKTELMLDAEEKILNQFQHHQNFQELYEAWNLDKFNRFSKTNKKIALSFMLKSKELFFTKRFLHALFKLIFKWKFQINSLFR
jgi:alpha-1,3-rhamnosyltransferase